MDKLQAFLRRKDIQFSVKRYGLDAFSAMASGLFASLLIGTIFGTIGEQTSLDFFKQIAQFAKGSTGPAMAVAIAYALKSPPLVLFSSLTVGFAANQLGGVGGALAVFVIALLTAEFGKMISKETKLDLIVTPALTIMVGVGLSYLLAPGIGKVAQVLGESIQLATQLQPFWMGMILAFSMGIALTLPISSAAICASLGLSGLAAGAALVGCCTHMVGFAILSFRDNRWSGLVAQGLGTSMLQMPNLVKKPRIALPVLLSSAVLGALSTTLFHFEMNGPSISAGMGTSGLVGPLGVYSGWLSELEQGVRQDILWQDWFTLFLLCVVLPALSVGLVGFLFRRRNWIQVGDFKLDL